MRQKIIGIKTVLTFCHSLNLLIFAQKIDIYTNKQYAKRCRTYVYRQVGKHISTQMTVAQKKSLALSLTVYIISWWRNNPTTVY